MEKKMFFYLKTLNLAKYSSEYAPAVDEEEANPQRRAAFDAWSDFLCKNYILKYIDNELYSLCSSIKIAKQFWESFDKKYKTNDVIVKKFIVGKFLDFKMVHS